MCFYGIKLLLNKIKKEVFILLISTPVVVFSLLMIAKILAEKHEASKAALVNIAIPIIFQFSQYITYDIILLLILAWSAGVFFNKSLHNIAEKLLK